MLFPTCNVLPDHLRARKSQMRVIDSLEMQHLWTTQSQRSINLESENNNKQRDNSLHGYITSVNHQVTHSLVYHYYRETSAIVHGMTFARNMLYCCTKTTQWFPPCFTAKSDFMRWFWLSLNYLPKSAQTAKNRYLHPSRYLHWQTMTIFKMTWALFWQLSTIISFQNSWRMVFQPQSQESGQPSSHTFEWTRVIVE